MKKIFLMLLLVCSSIFVFADGLTATLQHGDTMMVFYSTGALVEAYNAAANGDVITLSPGEFTSTTIKKSVRIVGAYGLHETDSYVTFLQGDFTVSADNVKLEGMYFKNSVILGNINNCIFKRCWLIGLLQSGTHTNTLIDQCVVRNDKAIETGVNYAIKNSTIECFGTMNTISNVANITNCFIYQFGYATRYNGETANRPYAVYKNNVLGLYVGYSISNSIFVNSPSEFYNNLFYPWTNDYSGYKFLIYYNAGCVNENNAFINEKSEVISVTYPRDSVYTIGELTVGVTGGEGFSKYPGIPRVLTSTIDAQTDDKGKLNATITVQAEK